jgi:hypothetical protein
MKNLFYRISFAIGGILVLLFINHVLASQHVRWTGCPQSCEGATAQIADRDAATQGAIKELAKMIRHCPQSTRYVVHWSYDGEYPLSSCEGETIYERTAKSLQFISGASFLDLTFQNVSDTDVLTVASHSGGFDDIERELQKSQQLPKRR